MLPSPEPDTACAPRSHWPWGSLCVLGGRLDPVLADEKPRELHLSPRELEFVGVEHQAVLVAVG